MALISIKIKYNFKTTIKIFKIQFVYRYLKFNIYYLILIGVNLRLKIKRFRIATLNLDQATFYKSEIIISD